MGLFLEVIVPVFIEFNGLHDFLLLPADLKLDFGRPIWIDIDLGLLERLKNFATDLNSQGTTPDGVHESGSESQVINIARSVAVSTDYVAITATAGHVSGVDPAIKASCSSMNLGVSLKADDREGMYRYICTPPLGNNFLGSCWKGGVKHI